MKGQNLRVLWESEGPAATIGKLSAALDSGDLRPSDFSFRELAEAFMGHEWVSRCNPATAMRAANARTLLEAGDAVDVSAFSHITGQIFFNKISEGWKQATETVDAMFDLVQTDLDGEKIPWLGNVLDEGSKIHPGMPYPETSFGERYIETPATDKFGQILSLTKEAIFFDRTGQMLKIAGTVGERLGNNKRKRCLRVLLGLTNNYKLNGTAYNTYQTSSWTNFQGSTPLVDYSSINVAYNLASKMLDPDTSEPIDIELKDLFVFPAKVMYAGRIINATEVSDNTTGFPTSGNAVRQTGRNPLPNAMTIHTSPVAYQLMYNAAGTQNATYAGYVEDVWIVGDFKKAFAYMQNWPLTVVQSPPNSIKEFEQDIVARFKASERGAPAVIEPRQVFQFYNSGTLSNGVFA